MKTNKIDLATSYILESLIQISQLSHITQSSPCSTELILKRKNFNLYQKSASPFHISNKYNKKSYLLKRKSYQDLIISQDGRTLFKRILFTSGRYDI